MDAISYYVVNSCNPCTLIDGWLVHLVATAVRKAVNNNIYQYKHLHAVSADIKIGVPPKTYFFFCLFGAERSACLSQFSAYFRDCITWLI